MALWRAQYHFTVSVRGGGGLPDQTDVWVSRTCWADVEHRTSQQVLRLSLPRRDRLVDSPSAIDQAISFAELALAEMIAYREGQTPDAYDHP